MTNLPDKPDNHPATRWRGTVVRSDGSLTITRPWGTAWLSADRNRPGYVARTPDSMWGRLWHAPIDVAGVTALPQLLVIAVALPMMIGVWLATSLPGSLFGLNIAPARLPIGIGGLLVVPVLVAILLPHPMEKKYPRTAVSRTGPVVQLLDTSREGNDLIDVLFAGDMPLPLIDQCDNAPDVLDRAWQVTRRAHALGVPDVASVIRSTLTAARDGSDLDELDQLCTQLTDDLQRLSDTRIAERRQIDGGTHERIRGILATEPGWADDDPQ